MIWPFTRNHAKPAAFADFEAQTASGNAAALARRGHALRKAKQDEMTARLRMEIAAGYVAHMRERSHG